MASRLGCSIFFLACTSAASLDDGMGLVQSRLSSKELNASNNSSFNATPAPTPTPINLFRILFTKTHGATYVCNTEIKFFNALLEEEDAIFVEQSSCYGCATKCDTNGAYCSQEYGSPLAQFDHITNSTEGAVDTSLWSCTQQGGMPDGNGMESVVFELPKTPARYEIHRALASDSAPSSWVLQEKEKWPSENWFDIDSVDDAPNALKWGKDLLTDGRYESLVFPATCPDNRTQLASDIDSPPFSVNYKAVGSRFLKHNDYTVQVDGDFGTMTVSDVTYNAKQIRFHLPTTRSIDEEQYTSPGAPVGEMHILHESQFELGKRQRLLVVSILMRLPLEGSDATAEELFFRNIGLEDLSADNKDPYGPFVVDLGGTFGEALNSAYATLDCDDPDLTWVVVSKPAHCAAKVVESFMQAFGPSVEPPSALSVAEAIDQLTEQAEAEAGGETGTAAAVPLHPGRARDLPLHAKQLALSGGEYLASLKGSVALENASVEA